MWKKLTPRYFFAHRGACAHAPENTLAAFQLALEQGAPAIEFDVKLSADNQVMVIHDPTLNRTTNGSGFVKDFPLKELKKLDAGSKFGAKFANEPIPTLDEVFETLGNKIFMNIELTNYNTPMDRLVDKVCQLINEHSLHESVMFSSFFPSNLIRARQLLPAIPRGQLALEGPNGWWQRLWGNYLDLQAVHPYTSGVTAKTVAAARARKRRVHVWTVNDPADMRRLRELGVEGIFTDDPLLAKENFL
jgi:glycerophosphoryl diester phosphodiesterase